MSVYVDILTPCLTSPRWRWPKSCHLFAESWSELHDFAARLGLKHSWFQHKPGSLPHYDLNESMRAKAVALGAVELTDRREIVRAYARCGHKGAQGVVKRMDQKGAAV